LAAGRVDDALVLVRRNKIAAEPADSNDLKLIRRPQTPKPATADLKIARLETIVAASRRANSKLDSGQVEALGKEIIARVNEIGSVHGPSWRRRAELVATPAAYENVELAGAASPELLALRFVRENKIDEAIAAYDRAANKAKQENSVERLFAATLAAARLEAGQGRLEAASQRCRAIARDNKSHTEAATVHLWASEYARQRLSAEKSPPSELLVDFQKLLAEQVENWPGESADDIRAVQQRLPK
jgi:hypothetical protein